MSTQIHTQTPDSTRSVSSKVAPSDEPTAADLESGTKDSSNSKPSSVNSKRGSSTDSANETLY